MYVVYHYANHEEQSNQINSNYFLTVCAIPSVKTIDIRRTLAAVYTASSDISAFFVNWNTLLLPEG